MQKKNLSKTFLVVLDLLVVLSEVSLASVHPELPGRCVHPPHAAGEAARALHILTLTLLAVLNVDWVVRAVLIGPVRFFSELKHWIDSGLVAAALALELLLVGEAAVAANLAVIVLRLARIGHAFVEIAVEEGELKEKRARSSARREAARRLLRVAAAAAVANARADRSRGAAAAASSATGRGGKGRKDGGDGNGGDGDDNDSSWSRRGGVPVVKGVVGSQSVVDGLV